MAIVDSASRRNGMKKTLTSVLAMAMAMSAVLPGCTDTETRALIDKDAQTAASGLNEAARPAVPPKLYNPLVVSDKVWTGTTSVHMSHGVPLPQKYESAHGITMVSAEPMSVVEILESIQKQTGITVHSSDYLVGSGAARATRAPRSSTGGTESSDISSKTDSMPVTYEGPLSGLLDRFAGYFGLNWSYDGTVIYITRFETKVFTVEALPGTQQIHDGMQDDSSGGGSSGGSSGGSGSSGSSGQSTITQNSKFNIDFKYWEELEKVINSMLNGVGSAVISPSLGTVTVTTNQRIMQQIADYLAEENQRISRQIAVNVEIYSVSLTKGMDYNIAFNTALRRMGMLSANFGTSAAAPTSVSGFTGGGALSLAILNPHTYTQEVTDIFTALSGIGDTTKVAKFPLITLNNRPVSRRIGQEVSYVQSASSNTTGSGSSSTFAGTTLTPGTVHQGFSVQLTPRLLDDGRILLQYSLSIIDVIAITSFNSVTGSNSATASTAAGSSTIQLPRTSNRIFVQQSVLKSGSTLFIGGADEVDASQNQQGVGDPSNYLLGGGISSGTSHTMLFFALTPQVLDTPHSEQE